MERRFNRDLSNESRRCEILQKKLAESKVKTQKENAPDLTDFMNDMFFGTINTDTNKKKEYNLTGTGSGKSSKGYRDDGDNEDFDTSIRSTDSNSSRLTQEWLVEAKRLVAASPTRHESPSKRIGSPRFAKSKETTLPISSSILERRDPLSRSARRHRPLESFSGEILSKTAKHTRNKSETPTLEIPPSNEPSATQPFHAVQKWISNIIHPQEEKNSPTASTTSDHHPPFPPIFSPRLSTGHRKSRFQAHQQAPPAREFKISNPNSNGTQLLSPPRDFSGSLEVLSPPRNLIVSAQRRSISLSTCRNVSNEKTNGEEFIHQDLNAFLKERGREFERITNGEIKKKAKIVLSGSSNS
ncbi:hypothetical protein Leryth_026195 [Lithospermum erythrorhizon]|nr:hypothetical protein Leryth_026195 [Lithospermum erythrorhizon]